MTQISGSVWQAHVPDAAALHPGGTNIYFIGDPREEMCILDTGEQQRSWTRQILDYHRELGRPRIAFILVTHGHRDHVGGLDRIQEAVGAPVRCHPSLTPDLRLVLGDDGPATPLRDGETLSVGGRALQTIFTPGHSPDSVCFYMPDEHILFTGDTVLGASSTTVGDLGAYMDSLRGLAALPVQTVCPGHGPVLPPPKGAQTIEWYLRHRQEREEQVLAALGRGRTQVDEIVRDVYPSDLARTLWSAAAQNVRTHLNKLIKEGRVVAKDAAYALREQ